MEKYELTFKTSIKAIGSDAEDTINELSDEILEIFKKHGFIITETGYDCSIKELT